MHHMLTAGSHRQPARPVVFGLIAVIGCWAFSICAAAQPTENAQLDAIHKASGFSGITLIHQASTDNLMAGSAQADMRVTADTAVLPASTFKIFSTLVSLQTGVVAGADSLLDWDGTIRSRPETNRDMTLREAFALSSVPHYQQLVESIGSSRMQAMLNAAEYGNQNMGGGLTTFWLSGELRISPSQQIDLLQRLHGDDLPFDSEVMSATRDIMRMEQTASYELFAKTGLTTADDGGYVGWYVGWVEQENDTWYFATLLRSEGEDDALIPARIDITRRALESVGALP